MNTKSKLFLACLQASFMVLPANAQAEPIKHQVTGLFMPEREQALRQAVAKMPQVKLLSVDYANAEAVFDYDPAKLFPGAKPADLPGRMDGLLKPASNYTLGIKPLRTVPREKLRLIEVPVAGLDCQACCLAAYEAVARLDGVERATASFREGRVTALIDPAKIDRAKVEAALKRIDVDVKAR